MTRRLIKTALALGLVLAAVVIVISPFVDLPPTVQNTKIHIALAFLTASILLVFQFRPQLAIFLFCPSVSGLHSDKLDLLVVHRC
jgi:hypothetical protein